MTKNAAEELDYSFKLAEETNKYDGRKFATFTCYNCKKECIELKKGLITRGHSSKGEKYHNTTGLRHYCRECAEALNMWKR